MGGWVVGGIYGVHERCKPPQTVETNVFDGCLNTCRVVVVVVDVIIVVLPGWGIKTISVSL